MAIGGTPLLLYLFVNGFSADPPSMSKLMETYTYKRELLFFCTIISGLQTLSAYKSIKYEALGKATKYNEYVDSCQLYFFIICFFCAVCYGLYAGPSFGIKYIEPIIHLYGFEIYMNYFFVTLFFLAFIHESAIVLKDR